ncbi:MAG TPA: methylmalonyl-CoA mutase family protein [Candidatus Limnocylindrales bacterium]|nr:methylmalonyl-CoA mutase family protein [Candidatus Limnocylindrales bacterium]
MATPARQKHRQPDADAISEAAPEPVSDSGIPLNPVYGKADVREDPPPPGAYPFTRGIYPRMYRQRLWTIRQYAGFGTAAETNKRFRFLLGQGQTGLSAAFDLPTQIGHDADAPIARGEVGKVGVSISSLRDMEALFEDIPLDRVSTSMTINAPAALLLLLYELVAEQQGVAGTQLNGTVQNDILKEFAARGTYIFPPRPSMRLVTDLFNYCEARLPNWNTISISGYHIREAGATAVQELGFTMAHAIAYGEACRRSGLPLEKAAPRMSFFFAVFSDFFEEVAKFRAARRLWATIVKERFGIDDPRAQMLRFHAQTGGSTLTAQQPHNNVVRVALQSLSAILGGTQSLHANSFDEALGLPSQEAATLSVRTQQVLAHETNVAAVADPLGGSYLVEALTDELEERARALMAEIDRRGGAVEAIESGFTQAAIQESAYRQQQAVERGERVVVGVNRYRDQERDVPTEIVRIGPRFEEEQIDALRRLRAGRDADRVKAALDDVRSAARGTENLLPPMREALRAYATIGEVCGVLREAFGEYRPGSRD